MNSEQMLPYEERIESYAHECKHELDAELAESRLKNGLHDVLDVDLEFYDFYYLLSHATLAKILEQASVLPGGKDQAAYEAFYRGIVFSAQVVSAIHGENGRFDAGSYLEPLQEREDAFDQILEDVQGYLGANPALEDFINEYMDELDGGRNRMHHVQLGIGLMLMLCERGYADNYFSRAAEYLEPEDFGAS